MIRIVNVSHVTRELPAAVLDALRAAYPTLLLAVHDRIDYETPDLQIVICPAGLGLGGPIRRPRRYLALQLEEYHVLSNPHYREFIQGAEFYWDYCALNVRKARELYPSLRPVLARIGYSPSVAGRIRPYRDADRPIDVLFLGWVDVHPRRARILAQMSAFCTVYSTHEAGVAEMQRLIQRAKICVNIHGKDVFVLQTVRLNLLLSNKACVVSEPPEDADAQRFYEPSVVFSSDPAEEVRRLLQDEPRRLSIAEQSHSWYRSVPWELPGLLDI